MTPDPDRVVEQYQKGNTINVIAFNIWHTSPKTISKILRDRGIKIRPSQWNRDYHRVLPLNNSNYDKETG